MLLKNTTLLLFACMFFVINGWSQKTGTSLASYSSFIDYQRTLQRPSEALQRKEDTLRKQFEAKKLMWPAKFIYIRSFKYDSQLEVWVKNEVAEPFKLFKTYRVCALAGTLGPKRMEGDFQVPEGFYYINEFNPKSQYYLSLGLNYPNVSDRILSDSLRPGGDIYIHGSCVTVGCIPVTDAQIDELYILAAHAKNNGQDFIPVHIFPVRYNVKKSADYLASLTKDDADLKKFEKPLETAYNYFEKNHQLPITMTNEDGSYVVAEGTVRKGYLTEIVTDEKTNKKVLVKKNIPPRRVREINDLASTVYQLPQYPGGVQGFLRFINKISNDMSLYLPAGVSKAYIKVEFVVDKDGVPVNFKIVKGLDDDFDEELITRLEKMENWEPAIFNEKPVAKLMVQSIDIVR